MSQIHDIQVILVLYKQKIENSKSYISLKRICNGQELDLYIYDNSPSPSTYEIADKSVSNIKIEYVHDPSNPGVSKAYNQGALHALNNGKKWLLLLDQDSELDKNIFNEFITEQRKYCDTFLFVPLLKSGEHYISPCKYYLNKGFTTKKKRVGLLNNKFKSILNSGIFIKVTTFFEIGGYDENVPLYFSDFIFFKKYTKIYDSFVVLDSTINHELSDMSNKTLSNSIRTFSLFCDGARQATLGIFDYLKYSIIITGRALVLIVRHKNLTFIGVLIKGFFFKKKISKIANELYAT